MKAYELVPGVSGLQALKLVEKPEPEPGFGEIKIRVRALSLNNRDNQILNNQYSQRNAPLQPISDGAGEVVAVGPGVQRFKVGDRVVPHFWPAWRDGPVTAAKTAASLGMQLPGMAAEYTVHDEDGVVALPSALSFEEGASLPGAAVTAWCSLIGGANQPLLTPGQSVLTLGTGGVSMFALQVGKLAGAKVIITSSSDEKLERCKALGADVAINRVKNPEWEKTVREATGGLGVDHAIEVGGAATFPKTATATAIGGRINMIGTLGGSREPVPLGLTFGRTMVGILVGSRAMFEAMLKAFAARNVKPVIDEKRFAFDELGQSLAHLATGSHIGKVVVSVK
jgi:NADPH:quinone reductase-like Zn-dependent oxidoreductase